MAVGEPFADSECAGLKPHLLWSVQAVDQLVSAWQLAAQRRMDLDLSSDLYALSVPDDMAVTYKEVLAVVQALTAFNAQYPNNRHPLLVMAKQDLGKVLNNGITAGVAWA